jgi:Na+-transporting NADH:ubiquinone oxidoreductase subunit A
MNSLTLKKGLNLPISGKPVQEIRQGADIKHVALVGDDTVGMKPTMLVEVNDWVRIGQALFTDKKNEGVRFCSPGCGRVVAINRGAKRKFESLVIELSAEESQHFFEPSMEDASSMDGDRIRAILQESGMWASFRTRPHGKIPAVSTTPASLFITAVDSSPLAADPQVVIAASPKEYQLGLVMLRRLLHVAIHYCTGSTELLEEEKLATLDYHCFTGPHPSGLPSTHIHFVDPVHEDKTVWHIDYQDVIDLGHLFDTGMLRTEKIIALGGSGVGKPSLISTRIGASLPELCSSELNEGTLRVLSGSVLNGRISSGNESFLGRYHNQVSVIEESNGRSFLNWASPGSDRFSVIPLFISALRQGLHLPFSTALWGGKRAIYPLGTYERMMPMDIIATSLLKALAMGDTEKSQDLGCLELIEEDLALCSFVCPGKNEFAHSLRQVLTAIERGD